MGFFWQKYQSGLPCSPPRDLPNSGIELMIPVSPGLQIDSSPTESLGKPIQSFMSIQYCYEIMNTFLILWIITQYYFIYFADQIILTLVIRSSFKLTHESLWHASYFVFTSLTFGSQGFPGSSDGKSVCQQCRRPGFDPWVRKIPWRRQWQPTPVFLPGKFHGRRSLVGYSPRSHKESDTTEQLHFQFNFKFWYTSRYTLHIIWFRSRVNHFSQVPWFLSLKNNIKNQD